MDTETKQQFEKMDQRFEKMDQRFEKMDQRFDDLIATMDQKFEKLITTMNQRFKEVDDTHLSFYEKFFLIDERFDTIDLKLGQHDVLFEKMDKKFTSFLDDARKDRELAQEREEKRIQREAKHDDEMIALTYRMSCHDRDLGIIKQKMNLAS